MENDLRSWPQSINHAIEQAHLEAQSGDMFSATRWFAVARELSILLAPSGYVTEKVGGFDGKMREEAERVRAVYLGLSDENAPVRFVIYADSLGLPRPFEFAQDSHCYEKTYSGKIIELLEKQFGIKNVHIDSHCERYLTSTAVLELLEKRAEQAENAHVLVHVGLNDYASRMFLADQRILIENLPSDISDKIVTFAQQYRLDILKLLPSRRYVPLSKFVANVNEIVGLAQKNGCASVTFCTIITPPIRKWASTPNAIHDVSEYNMALMTEAQKGNINLLHVDRIAWGYGFYQTVLRDGMRLTHKGHSLFAQHYLSSIKLNKVG